MGLGAELCALAAEAGVLDVPPVRVAMPDIPGIPVDDNLEDAVLPNRATIRDALVRLVTCAAARGRGEEPRGVRRRDPAGVEHRARSRCRTSTRVPRSTRSSARRARCRRAMRRSLDAGSSSTTNVVVDLDLGPASPAAGRGTITLIDYGPGGSDLAIPFVRPGQTAALRIGAVRDGRAYVACAVDHRAVDGADAGRFLAAFKRALERGARS